ncbi:hypothetical protein JR338_07035 [Chloroflexota bacterium]|nr:hypothetical protein JR338_07035 [Chloroflexota bacterium]
MDDEGQNEFLAVSKSHSMPQFVLTFSTLKARVLKQHKINVTMTKNGRQEKQACQGVRVLLEISAIVIAADNAALRS